MSGLKCEHRVNGFGHAHFGKHAGSLHTAPALLCPLSGTSSAFPLHKQVTSLGTGESLHCFRHSQETLLFFTPGSEVDINLSEFGHCNYISPRQACIFYDRVST